MKIMPKWVVIIGWTKGKNFFASLFWVCVIL